MSKPTRKECKCRPNVKCQCEGWNQACEVWEEYFNLWEHNLISAQKSELDMAAKLDKKYHLYQDNFKETV